MKIRKILLYLELILLLGLFVTHIVIFPAPFSYRINAKIDLEEGDIIQLTITDYFFEYNMTFFEHFDAIAGIYLNPIFDFKEGVEQSMSEQFLNYSNIVLFEGNSSSTLDFNFHVDSISKKKTVANLTLDKNNQTITLGMFDLNDGVDNPFFEPALAIGLTFKSNSYLYNRTYVHWRYMYIFSSKDARPALNKQAKHSLLPHFYTKGDTDTFISNIFDEEDFVSIITYKLRPKSNRLQSVSYNFVGHESFGGGLVPPYTSNYSTYVGIPYKSYWNFHIECQLRYFRGGVEI